MIVEVKLIHAACLPPWALVFAPDLIFCIVYSSSPTTMAKQYWIPPGNKGLCVLGGRLYITYFFFSGV